MNTIEEAANLYAIKNYGVPTISCSSDTFKNAEEDFVAGATSKEAKDFHTKGMYDEAEVSRLFKLACKKGRYTPNMDMKMIEKWFNENKKK